MQSQQREVQEELAMDMKFLQDLLQQTDNLAQMEADKRKQLREEMKMYKGYLEEQRKEEERREKELDSMVQAEVCVMSMST